MSASLVATVLADRAPARALRDQIEALLLDGTDAARAEGAALFESVFWRLPPFADARLPAIAAQAFRGNVARLLEGLAAQLTTPAPAPSDAEGAEIVAVADQDHALLSALERRGRTLDWTGSAGLFEAVWPCLRPIGEYWVYFRMSAVYEQLDRPEEAALLAALAVQIQPASREANEPYARLLAMFRRAGRPRDAAELAVRQRALCPHAPVIGDAELVDLLTEAGPLAVAAPKPAGQVHTLFPRTHRPAHRWRSFGNGVPNCLKELAVPAERDGVSVVELADAEVLVADDTVAVFSADGAIQTEQSVGRVPTLLPRRFAELAQAGRAPMQHRLDRAVLLNDEFPPPNLCHFLFDHAPRLLLYRRAGVDLAAATVIGPRQCEKYQHETVARIGVGGWHDTDAPARLHVARLYVASNCRHLRHPAHWGSDWAITDMRALFDLRPRARTRRLLISRADAGVRRVVNEAELASVLAPLGFEVIVPGLLSFAEQIAAFRDATHVVAPHGAGLANILFCAPRTHVLEVFHPHYGTWAYAMAAAALGLDYATLVAGDGASDAAEFNDPAWELAARNAHANRDMRIDPASLRPWLAETGLS